MSKPTPSWSTYKIQNTSRKTNKDYTQPLKQQKLTKQKSARQGCSEWWDGVIRDTKNWLMIPRPFLYGATIITISGWACFFMKYAFDGRYNSLDDVVLSVVYCFLVATSTFVVYAILFVIAAIGTDTHNNLFNPNMEYTEAFKNFGNGLGEIFLFLAWGLWKYILIGIWKATVFFCRFVKVLFKLIHSQKRLLCGVDGTIGGVASYFWLAQSANSTGGQLVLVIFGGLLGAGFGVLNWEIVSKRILHVVEES